MRLKKKRVLQKEDYLNKVNEPFRNKSLKNLKAERWVAIPGFEGSYEISSYGRAKSLAREIHYANGKVIHKKEDILLAGVSPAPNYIVGDHTYQLLLHLRAQNKIYHFSVARLVYQCFVKELPANDNSIRVIQKDGNGLNCHYKNLLAVSSSDMLKRAFVRERQTSIFRWMDMTQNRIKAVEANCQVVTQYNLKGKRIRIYKSMVDASGATGICKESISAATRGCSYTAGNCIWIKGKGKARINPDEYLQGRRATYRETKGRKVTQYSLDLHFIKAYSSIVEAAESTGIHRSNINAAVRGEIKTAGGFIWKPIKKNPSSGFVSIKEE